jgi:hypothetical protein
MTGVYSKTCFFIWNQEAFLFSKNVFLLGSNVRGRAMIDKYMFISFLSIFSLIHVTLYGMKYFFIFPPTSPFFYCWIYKVAPIFWCFSWASFCFIWNTLIMEFSNTCEKHINCFLLGYIYPDDRLTVGLDPSFRNAFL